MIKRTLYFSNPTYLSLSNRQLCIRKPKEGSAEKELIRTIPIEDIGMMVLDCPQITITQALISELSDNNVALVSCGNNHIPIGLLLTLSGNNIHQERFRSQLEASLPLKKQIWQQTVSAKIINQEAVLRWVTGEKHNNMLVWAKNIKSGDSDNLEARAAVYYWKTLFPSDPLFVRNKDGEDINCVFNYGYAILRAIVARALIGSGLLPIMGVHHHNRYNAYCLADDIMEPYRPYVDKFILQITENNSKTIITDAIKLRLLEIPTLDVNFDSRKSPLMVAVSRTTYSLYQCFSGEIRKIIYPIIL